MQGGNRKMRDLCHVSLENIRLQLDDIEASVAEVKQDLLRFLATPDPVFCEVCDLETALTQALREEWQNLHEVDGVFLAVCPDCHAKGPRDELPDESVFCTACPAQTSGVMPALQSGWGRIANAEGNNRGNYSAVCPSCFEDDFRRRAKSVSRSRKLF